MKPNILDMHPVLYQRYLQFQFVASQESEVPFQLNCVLRTLAEQTALHAQGREPLEVVNALRKAANMPWMITASENLKPVTWTMKSKHFPDHNGQSRAFDYVVMKNGRVASWDLKWDEDKDNIADYEELARAAEKCGLVAGGHAFGDWPHVQLPDDVA